MAKQYETNGNFKKKGSVGKWESFVQGWNGVDMSGGVFTHRGGEGHRSVLDRWVVRGEWGDVEVVHFPWSDHDMVVLSKTSSRERVKTWKANTSHLKDKVLVKDLKVVVEEWK